MLCPPSEVKNQSRSLFLNLNLVQIVEDEKQVDVHTFRPEDGVILVALVPACLLQLHSFFQYASN